MSQDLITTSLDMLGVQVRDRVTGFRGVAGSITFDAYGCVQVLVTPPCVDNKRIDSEWFDVKRVVTDGERVIEAPDFAIPYGDERGGNSLPAPKSGPR